MFAVIKIHKVLTQKKSKADNLFVNKLDTSRGIKPT